MKSKYWYDPVTGDILHRTDSRGLQKFNLPYFEKSEPGWNWSNWRVDIATGGLIERPNPHGNGVDHRVPNFDQ